jgi:hypothetical protein
MVVGSFFIIIFFVREIIICFNSLVFFFLLNQKWFQPLQHLCLMKLLLLQPFMTRLQYAVCLSYFSFSFFAVVTCHMLVPLVLSFLHWFYR